MMHAKVNEERIFVGMSGGVDSAVTAALLKQAGHQVTGVFIKGWYPPGMICTWAEDRRDAMRAAAHLGIPFHTLDAAEAYKRAVIDYLLDEYRVGRTPNPDIMCNREVKFGVFHSYAKKARVHRIATGHYARTEGGKLFRGTDTSKDQSYFLWAVPNEILGDVLFPLGNLVKAEVRRRAAYLGLPNAKKKDSQGICFLGSISVDEFLRAELGTERGKAVTPEGKDVGTHDGAVLYTLGERIALYDASPGPWYVRRKDLATNILVVSHERAPVVSPAIAIRTPNWFAGVPEGSVQAQYRYHGPLVTGDFNDHVFTPHQTLSEPVASGQSLVVYQGDECLGGGIIK